MTGSEPHPGGDPLPRSDAFETTQWSIVIAAGGDSPRARIALARLCEAYWYPLYAFVRRRGYTVDDARELTQAFFAEFLEKNRVLAADEARGRFRSFLIASLRHFLSNQHRDARALKRGGGRAALSLDFAAGESRYQIEPFHEESPERIFERRWAATLLEQTISDLRGEYARQDRESLFTELAPGIGVGEVAGNYAEIATRLGMTEGAVKAAAHRLRQRCRELLHHHVAQTVSHPHEIDDELRDLFRIVATP